MADPSDADADDRSYRSSHNGEGAEMTAHAEQFETVIVGGGQVGLAAAYYLEQQGMEHVILDAGERVGDPWRARWPSLHLYTPAKYDELPGMRFPGRRSAFPSTNAMADYLEAYAERFGLHVRNGVHVDGLSRANGRYELRAGEQRLLTDNVIVATGVMQAPVVPAFASELGPQITQLHSNDYRGPEQLDDGPVLVVGASHSGADIAHELAATHEVVLSGPDRGQLPFSVESRRARLGFPVLKRLWTYVLTVDTPIGRKIKPEIRSQGALLLRYRKSDLEAAGVERVLARVAGVRAGLPTLDDGRVLDVANVVWCTGFRPDYSWIDLPLEYEGAYPKQYRGAVEGHPGLYFLGMLFLHAFSSMLVLGAGRDAQRVVEHIAARPKERRVGVHESQLEAVA
jgi:putative flavoprotein involved in K+ transport